METKPLLRIESHLRLLEGQGLTWWRSDPERLSNLVVFFVVLLVAFGLYQGNRDMLRAAYAVGERNSQTTNGEVLEIVSSPFLCTGTESGESARYRYSVEERNYVAVFPINPRGIYPKIKVGDTVAVEFVIDEPERSIISNQVSGMNLYVGPWLFCWGFLIGGVGILYNLYRTVQLYNCRRGGEVVDATIASVEKSRMKGKKRIVYRFVSPRTGSEIGGKANVSVEHPFESGIPAKVWYKSDKLYFLM